MTGVQETLRHPLWVLLKGKTQYVLWKAREKLIIYVFIMTGVQETLRHPLSVLLEGQGASDCLEEEAATGRICVRWICAAACVHGYLSL